MSNNLSKMQSHSFSGVSKVGCPLVFETKDGRLLDSGVIGQVEISFSGDKPEKEIRREQNLSHESVEALKTAESASVKLFQSYGLMNPYGHWGVQCRVAPKEKFWTGASLGIAAFVGIVSALTGKQVSEDVVFSGLVEGDGKIKGFSPDHKCSVDILKHKLKVVQNRSDGIRYLIIPAEYEKDLAELQDDYPFSIKLVSNVHDLLPIIFGDDAEACLKNAVRQLTEWIVALVCRHKQIGAFKYQSLSSIREAQTAEDRKALVERFYRGQDISLEAIHHSLAVRRKKTEDWLLEQILCERPSSRLVVVFADPYQGKSTLLRSLQYELLQKEKIVCWNQNRSYINWQDIDTMANVLCKGLEGKERFYLLVDDIEQCADWPNFLTEVTALRSEAVVVATCSSTYKDDPIFLQLSSQPVTTGLVLREDETETFVQKLKENDILDGSSAGSKDVPYTRQLSEFLARIGLPNLVDNYAATLVAKLRRLELPVRKAVHLACSLGAFQVWMPVKLLERIGYSAGHIRLKAEDIVVPVYSYDGGPLEYVRLPSCQIAERILEDGANHNGWKVEEALNTIATNIEPEEIATATNLCLALVQMEKFKSLLTSSAFASMIQRLIHKTPSWKGVLVWAEVYTQLGSQAGIETAFRRALTLVSEQAPSSVAYVYCQFGLALYKLGEYTAAREKFLDACTGSNGGNFPYWMAGECYAKEGQFRKAVRFYIKSAKLENTSQGYGTALQKIRSLMDCQLERNLAHQLGRLRLSLAKRAVSADPNKAKNHGDLGTEYRQTGKLGDAIETFKEVVRLDPTDDYPYFQIAECYADSGNFAEAKAWYLKGARTEYASKKSLKGYAGLAFKLLQQEDLETFSSLCSEIESLDPPAFDDYLNCWEFGKVLVEAKQFEEALPYLEQAKKHLIQAHSGSEEKKLLAALWQRIAECHEATRDFKTAMSAYREYVEQLDGDYKAYGFLGRKALDCRMYEDAVWFLAKSVEKEPRNATNWSQLAVAKMNLEDYSGAYDAFQKAIQIRQDNLAAGSATWQDRNRLEQDKEQSKICAAKVAMPKEEIEMSENQSQQLKSMIQAYLKEAQSLEKKGSRLKKEGWKEKLEIVDEEAIEQACERYLKVAESYDNGVSWGIYAHNLFRLKRKPERVKEAFEKSIQCDSQNFKSLSAYGHILLQLGDYNGAIQVLSQAIDVGSRQSVLPFYLARTYVNRGKGHKQLKNFGPAHDDFSSAVNIAGGPKVYYLIGQALKEVAALEPALAADKKATELDKITKVAAASEQADELVSSVVDEGAKKGAPKLCPACSFENLDETKFCIECGTALLNRVPCPKCGSQNLPRAKFCGECGTSLTRN